MKRRFSLTLKFKEKNITLKFNHRGGDFGLPDYHVHSEDGDHNFCVKHDSELVLYSVESKHSNNAYIKDMEKLLNQNKGKIIL